MGGHKIKGFEPELSIKYAILKAFFKQKPSLYQYFLSCATGTNVLRN